MKTAEENKRMCKRYYANNTEKRKTAVKERQQNLRRKLRSYKLTRGCSKCGYNKCGRALSFHHINDKADSVSKMCVQGRRWERILEEISKCVLVCANCHAEIHEELDGTIV